MLPDTRSGEAPPSVRSSDFNSRSSLTPQYLSGRFRPLGSWLSDDLAKFRLLPFGRRGKPVRKRNWLRKENRKAPRTGTSSSPCASRPSARYSHRASYPQIPPTRQNIHAAGSPASEVGGKGCLAAMSGLLTTSYCSLRRTRPKRDPDRRFRRWQRLGGRLNCYSRAA